MERLTYRKDGKAVNCKCYDWCATCTGAECLEVQRVVDRLAEYEDAEEQGLLVCLPCKLGDTVYIHWFEHDNVEVVEKPFSYGMIPYIGETVFLTREEAEAALAKEG